jgi:hypothetical protein
MVFQPESHLKFLCFLCFTEILIDFAVAGLRIGYTWRRTHPVLSKRETPSWVSADGMIRRAKTKIEVWDTLR